MLLTTHAPSSVFIWLEHLLRISLEDHLWVLTLLRLEWLKVLFTFSLWKSSFPFSIFYVFLRFWNFTMMSIYWTSKIFFLFSTWTLSGSDDVHSFNLSMLIFLWFWKVLGDKFFKHYLPSILSTPFLKQTSNYHPSAGSLLSFILLLPILYTP